jgi:hypothetical protein
MVKKKPPKQLSAAAPDPDDDADSPGVPPVPPPEPVAPELPAEEDEPLEQPPAQDPLPGTEVEPPPGEPVSLAQLIEAPQQLLAPQVMGPPPPTESYTRGATARGVKTPLLNHIIPDSVASAPQTYTRNGQSFVGIGPDGVMRWYRIDATLGGYTGAVVLQQAGLGT